MSQPTLAELRRDHMRGTHESVPVFGCPSCVEKRDAFWICACNLMQGSTCIWCEFCESSAPERFIIKKALGGNVTPIKTEAGRG